MLRTISTTHAPASDLGFRLHKHPQRFQSFDPVGTYAASVVLALLAVGTLLAMNLFRQKEGEE